MSACAAGGTVAQISGGTGGVGSCMPLFYHGAMRRDSPFCATRLNGYIDRDEVRFTRSLLEQWKADHELALMTGRLVPGLPQISATTSRGLTLPQTANVQVTGSDVERYREHLLVIRNGSRQKIESIHFRIQFPEAWVGHELKESPAGRTVQVKEDRAEMTVFASGGGGVIRTGAPRPTYLWKLGIDALLPDEAVEITVWTVPRYPDRMRELALGEMGKTFSCHMLGSFKYEASGQYFQRDCVVPLAFDLDLRKIKSLPPDDDLDAYTLPQETLFL